MEGNCGVAGSRLRQTRGMSITTPRTNDAAPGRNRDPVPQDAIKAFLDELDDYVILRNHDIWTNLERGGDVDVLVDDPERCGQLLERHLGNPLLTVRRASVTSYVFLWGHIDVLSSLSWRGAQYLETRGVLQRAQLSELGFKRPSDADEAVVSWFSSLLAGAFFNERYAESIVGAARGAGEDLRARLHWAAGKEWGERLWLAAHAGDPGRSGRWGQPVRRAVWWRSLVRAPLRTLGGWLAHWRSELALRFRPPLPWCVVLGPDGSGKSAVISELERRFARSGVLEIAKFHWRPGIVLPRRDAGPVTDPHRDPARGMVGSVLQLVFLTADWTFGYWGRVVHLRAKGRLVVFDRHFIDLLVDPRRYRYGGPPGLSRWVTRLIPSPDVIILLDAPPEVLLQRKQEVLATEVARQRDAYRDLVTSLPNGRVVDASRDLSHVVDVTERIILAQLAERGEGAGRSHREGDVRHTYLGQGATRAASEHRPA